MEEPGEEDISKLGAVASANPIGSGNEMSITSDVESRLHEGLVPGNEMSMLSAERLDAEYLPRSGDLMVSLPFSKGSPTDPVLLYTPFPACPLV